jgi:hypothetical protein
VDTNVVFRAPVKEHAAFPAHLHFKAFRSISKRHSSLDRGPSSLYGASYEPLHSCFYFSAAVRLPL